MHFHFGNTIGAGGASMYFGLHQAGKNPVKINKHGATALLRKLASTIRRAKLYPAEIDGLSKAAIKLLPPLFLQKEQRTQFCVR
jgi:hypothetical protein